MELHPTHTPNEAAGETQVRRSFRERAAQLGLAGSTTTRAKEHTSGHPGASIGIVMRLHNAMHDRLCHSTQRGLVLKFLRNHSHQFPIAVRYVPGKDIVQRPAQTARHQHQEAAGRSHFNATHDFRLKYHRFGGRTGEKVAIFVSRLSEIVPNAARAVKWNSFKVLRQQAETEQPGGFLRIEQVVIDT
uniref:Uncharacterized protein n=1 Tax=Anopheles atroparvus TaxID=41427 RepID=A0A182JA81_ANOAO